MTTTQETFAGGVAVVTGAGSGIGEGLARHAASLGMKLVLADVAADRIARVAADIAAAGGEVLAVPTDVRDAAALDRLAAAAFDRFGEVRLLVNNAGIETLGLSWELPAETWDRIIDVNIRGVVHGVRAFAPRMLASGRPGFLANVSSVGGLGMMPAQNAYIMTKHAVLSFTEGLSLEMQAIAAPIHVAAILPGPVNTRVFADAPTGGDDAFVEGQRAFMQNQIAVGLTGLQAGEIILDGLAARQFWITTHPRMAAGMARRRAAYLTEQRTPTLTDPVRAALEHRRTHRPD